MTFCSYLLHSSQFLKSLHSEVCVCLVWYPHSIIYLHILQVTNISDVFNSTVDTAAMDMLLHAHIWTLMIISLVFITRRRYKRLEETQLLTKGGSWLLKTAS